MRNFQMLQLLNIESDLFFYRENTVIKKEGLQGGEIQMFMVGHMCSEDSA